MEDLSMPRRAKTTGEGLMTEPIFDTVGIVDGAAQTQTSAAKEASVAVEPVKVEPVKEAVKEAVKETVKKAMKAADVNAADLPGLVQKALKVFCNKEKLYVNSKGGVFSENTNRALLGDAKLYKNPFFKP